MANDLPDWASTVYQPDVAITGSPISYIAGFTTKTLAVPSGVHILNVVLPGFPNISLITVAGATSGVTYLAETPNENIFQKQYFVLIPQLVDTSVVVDITAGAPGTAYVSGMLAPLAVAQLAQNPAPWQAPNRPPLGFSFANPGAGNSVVILGAPINSMSIWLHSMSWTWTVAGATGGGNFQDSNGVIALKDVPITAGQARYQDFKGAKLSGGFDYQFTQVGALAANMTFCEGSVTYSVF